MAKYMDQSGAQHFAEALMSATKTINGQTIWGDGDITVGGEGLINITTPQLTTAIQQSQLIKGQLYVLTDYRATSNGVDSTPNGSGADTHIIIFRALGPARIDNNCILVNKYLMGTSSNVLPYYIKYIPQAQVADKCNWANLMSTSKGVIVWMEDPNRNLAAPCDWRPDYGLKSSSLGTPIFDNISTNCRIEPTVDVNGKYVFPNISISKGHYIKIGTNCSDIKIILSSNIDIGQNSQSLIINDSTNVQIGQGCSDIEIPTDEIDPNAGIWTDNISIGQDCAHIKLSIENHDVNIGNNSQYIYLHERNDHVTIGNNCKNIGGPANTTTTWWEDQDWSNSLGSFTAVNIHDNTKFVSGKFENLSQGNGNGIALDNVEIYGSLWVTIKSNNTSSYKIKNKSFKNNSSTDVMSLSIDSDFINGHGGANKCDYIWLGRLSGIGYFDYGAATSGVNSLEWKIAKPIGW